MNTEAVDLPVAEQAFAAGDVVGTEWLCRALLSDDADDVDALGLLGRVLLLKEGPTPEALGVLRKAAELAPSRADILHDTGVAWMRCGDLEQAGKAFDAALTAAPEDAAAGAKKSLLDALRQPEAADLGAALAVDERLLLARTLVGVGRHEEALRLLNALGTEAPEMIEVYPSLARAQAGLSDLDGMVQTCCRIRELCMARQLEPARRTVYMKEIEAVCGPLNQSRPNHPLTLAVLAIAKLEDPPTYHEGSALINQALQINSDVPEVLLACGYANFLVGEFEKAELALSMAVERRPDYREAEAKLFLSRAAVGGVTDDLDVPASVSADDFTILALALCYGGRFAEALQAYRQAQRRAPTRAALFFGASNVAGFLGLRAEAEKDCDTARRLDPVSPQARMQAAMLALERHDLETAWELYEERLRVWRRDSANRQFEVPRWDGEDLTGKTLLVWREEGVGDEIRGVSCLAELPEKFGCRVIWEGSPRLQALYAESLPGIEVRAEKSEPDPADYADIDAHVPLLSLPKYVRRRIEDFSDRGGYLSAPPQAVAAMRERLQAFGGSPKIGVCWRSTNMSWMKRPFHSSLADWSAIIGLSGLTFVNLQIDLAEREADQAEALYGQKIHRLDGLDLRDDLLGAAALIGALYAVVSARCWVPTLAGALGIDTYIFTAPPLPLAMGFEHDPWMPSVSIFPRPPGEGWSQPMADISGALKSRFLLS